MRNLARFCASLLLVLLFPVADAVAVDDAAGPPGDAAQRFVERLIQRTEFRDVSCPALFDGRSGRLRCGRVPPAGVLSRAHRLAFALARHEPVLEYRTHDGLPRHLLVGSFRVTLRVLPDGTVEEVGGEVRADDPLSRFRRVDYRFAQRRVVLWLGPDPDLDEGSLDAAEHTLVIEVVDADEPFPEIMPAGLR